MQRLQNTERVWWYIQREAQDALGRALTSDECVAAVVTVSALTKMLADEEATRRGATIDLDTVRA